MTDKSWGIVRYPPGYNPCDYRGPRAEVDSWYAHRRDALAVYQRWVKEHPDCLVALISTNMVRVAKW
jgi:hypothetical protein